MQNCTLMRVVRNGYLNLEIDYGVNEEIIYECCSFLRWLKKEKLFQKRISIHLCKEATVTTRKDRKVSAIFYSSNSSTESPSIEIATGDYEQNINQWGKFNALKAVLGSITHELIHYRQWLEGRKASEKEAKEGAREVVFEYIYCQIKQESNKIETLKKRATLHSLKKLLEIYDKGSTEIRIQVIEALATFSKFEEAKKFLVGLVSEIGYGFKSIALESLSCFSGDDVYKTVLTSLKDPNTDVRVEASKVMQYFVDENSINSLIENLTDRDELVRGYSAVALGITGSSNLIPILKDALYKENRTATKLRIFVGLYYLGQEEYINNILEELKSRSYLVRMAACYYLVNLANDKNKNNIMINLKKRLEKEKREEVIDAIKYALSEI